MFTKAAGKPEKYCVLHFIECKKDTFPIGD